MSGSFTCPTASLLEDAFVCPTASLLEDVLRTALDAACKRWVGADMRFDGCLIDLADIYLEALGKDPAVEWRGAYEDEAGMRAVLGWRGVLGALAKGAKMMGWAAIEPAEAKLGDLGLMMTGAGPAGVICLKNGFWIGRIEFGYSVNPVEFMGAPQICRAWSVC